MKTELKEIRRLRREKTKEVINLVKNYLFNYNIFFPYKGRLTEIGKKLHKYELDLSVLIGRPYNWAGIYAQTNNKVYQYYLRTVVQPYITNKIAYIQLYIKGEEKNTTIFLELLVPTLPDMGMLIFNIIGVDLEQKYAIVHPFICKKTNKIPYFLKNSFDTLPSLSLEKIDRLLDLTSIKRKITSIGDIPFFY